MRILLLLALLSVASYAQGHAYISDLTWVTQTNSWGPVERDESNGEDSAGDGVPISINGSAFSKGVGMHASASIELLISQDYRRFQAWVGIDDEVIIAEGSVVFQLWGDGVLLYDSGVRTHASAALFVDVDVSSVIVLELRVTDGGDNIGSDHADWGDAKLLRVGKLSSKGSTLRSRYVRDTPRALLGSIPNRKPKFGRTANSSFDPYLTTEYAAWLNSHLDYLQAYSTFFDTRLAFYPRAAVYYDSYAIYYNGGAGVPAENAWILLDGSANRLYIPYECSAGVCTQYAADIGSPAYRSYWIGKATDLLNIGYPLLWIDDVNLSYNVSNGAGVHVDPIDPRTGVAMTYDNYRRYFAEFMEAVRTALPAATIIHNPIWYSGPNPPQGWADQYIRRVIQSADIVEVEHGVIDAGIQGGTDTFSLFRLMMYMDYIHDLGKGTNLNGHATTDAEREYNLAAFYLTLANYEKDHIGERSQTPDNWWAGHDLNLGSPKSARTSPLTGLYRREFSGGIVLLNEPSATERTITLGGSYLDISGATVTSVTLSAKEAAVLRIP